MLKPPKAFYSIYAVGRMMGIPKPTVSGAVITKNINRIEALKPIAHLFVSFEDDGENTFAIRKIYFDRWRKTGKVSKKSTGRPPKWKDNPNLTNINIPFPKDLYEQFKQVVGNANAISVVKVSYRDMFAVAVKEFVERRPEFLGGDFDGSQRNN